MDLYILQTLFMRHPDDAIWKLVVFSKKIKNKKEVAKKSVLLENTLGACVCVCFIYIGEKEGYCVQFASVIWIEMLWLLHVSELGEVSKVRRVTEREREKKREREREWEFVMHLWSKWISLITPNKNQKINSNFHLWYLFSFETSVGFQFPILCGGNSILSKWRKKWHKRFAL